MALGPRDYSVFATYGKCSTDPFWQNFFEALGRGEFPKNFYYDENLRCVVFTSKKAAQRASVAVDKSTSTAETFKTFHLLQNFFRDRGISSPSDVTLGRLSDPGPVRVVATTWAEVKSKPMRKLLIHNFALRLTEVFELDVSPQLLADKIMLMISFQSIKPADIVISKGRIIGIKNVWVEGEEVSFPRVTRPRKAAPAKKEAPPPILQAIEKLIKDDRTRMVRV